MAGFSIPLDEQVHFDVVCHTTAGAISDADSTPTFDVYEEANDTGLLGATNFTKRTSLTGNYRGTFTASAANGFEVGKWYNVVASATVGAVAGKAICLTFMLRAAEATAGYEVITVKSGTGTGELSVSSGIVDADVREWLGTAAATPTVAGVPEVDVTHFNGTAGTFSSGRPEVNASHISGSSTAADNAEIVFATDFANNYNTAADCWVVQLDNTVTHGGTAAVLQLERIIVAATTTDEPAMKLTGNGSGQGLQVKGGDTGRGVSFTGGDSGGGGMLIEGTNTSNALLISSGSASAVLIAPADGHGIDIAPSGTNRHGLQVTGGTGGTSDGIKAVAGTGGVPIRGDITGNITGNLSGTVARALTLDEDTTTIDLDATIRSAVGLASANLDTQLDALPTAAEVWAAGTRTLTTLDEDSTTLDLDATIRSAVGLATANLDTQIGDLPTNAELATSQAAADDATLAAIAALNNLSSAQAQTAAAAALTAYDPPTNAEMEARTLVSADYATSTVLATVAADNPNRPTRGVELANLEFIMVDATDFNTPETGITVTAQVSKDGGAFAGCTNAVSEISAGAYKITLTATEQTADAMLLKLTGTGCATRFISWRNQPT